MKDRARRRFWVEKGKEGACFLTSAAGRAASTQCVFSPDCELPIRNATPAGRFERQCGEDGAFNGPTSDTPAHRAHNRAKNNFCAAGRARPIPLTFADFDQLQRCAFPMISLVSLIKIFSEA